MVLTRRGARPVKTGTGNKRFQKKPENYQRLLPVLVQNIGDISAPRYCTGSSKAPNKEGAFAPKHMKRNNQLATQLHDDESFQQTKSKADS